MAKAKLGSRKSSKQKSLTPDQVKEITDYIKERKDAGIDAVVIRKEVFKKFKIDTTQWELNWSPDAALVKGSNKNERVKEGQQLATTHNVTRRHEPVNFKHEFTEGEINERANILAQLEMDREALEEAKKNVTSEYKTKIDEKETQIGKVVREIHSGFEMRNETCEVIRNFSDSTKKSYFKSKLVKDEKLTTADFTLQFPEEPVEKETAVA